MHSIQKFFTLFCFFVMLISQQHGLAANAEKLNTYFIPDDVIIDTEMLKSEQLATVTDFEVGTNNTLYATIDGVLFSKDLRTIVAYPVGRNNDCFILPETVETIGSFAFFKSKIVYFSITEESKCLRIMNNAFQYCMTLQQICLPNTIEYIEQDAFVDCNNNCIFICEENSLVYDFTKSNGFVTIGLFDLMSVSEWMSIDWKLYEYPPLLNNIDGCKVVNGVLFRDQTLLAYPLKSSSDKYIIPEGTEMVIASIFQSNNVTELTIPSTCHTIWNYSQNPDGVLKTIYVDPLNECFGAVDGVLYTKDFSTLLCFPRNKQVDQYNICSETRCIASDAFAYNEYVKEVILPDGIERIELFSFYCANIETINLPSSISFLEIEAFESCGNLSKIYLEKGSYVESVFLANKDSDEFDFTNRIQYIH